jgi:gliding motility-associated-like protein
MKIRHTKITLLLLSFSCSFLASAQRYIVHSDKSISFHKANLESLLITESTAQAYLLNLFDLKQQHIFTESRRIKDFRGDTHVRYEHYYNGYRILGSDVIGHFQNSILFSINGRLRIPKTLRSNIIDENDALQAAKMSSGAKSFKWEFPEEEYMLKVWRNDTSATYFPKGELVYAPQNLDFSNELTLCYLFEINSEEPLMRKNIFINATNGTFWCEEDLLHIIDVKGTANTKYRGDRLIMTDSAAPGNYRLRESGRGGGVETYDMNKGTKYSAAVDFTDTDNYWNNYNANLDEIGGDAHYGAEMTYDYFKQNFNRNSFDDKGAKIRSYVHYRNNYVNAFWNGSVMTYGDGNGSTITPLTTVDICGHEIAHAVTSYSARLIYRNESGALNESFSDIFGNAVEYFADSNEFSWRMGEDIMASANGIRNMANPKTHRDPSTYKGQYWYSGKGDNGGVHTNSGVQNFWFYLLTNGATGTNDNGDSYTIDSLGINKAEQIAYRNLTVYLTASSDYDEARYYAIQSAADLYGQCSKEVHETTNAWYAVGVGDKYDSSAVLAQFGGDSNYCQANDTVRFLNTSVNAKSFIWHFGDGKTSTQINPKHTYPSQGTYTVSLIAESCYNNIMDTVKKIDYVLIDSTRDICNGYLLPKGAWDSVYACDGYIYDHNGESDYDGLLRDTLTVNFGTTDSAQITFLEMDYENRYDSIYVYDGASTKSRLLGGFTGRNLPFGGQKMVLYNGAVTIRHFSDPYVVGTGFKLKFETFKQALKLTKTEDKTVCLNESVTLMAEGTGGDTSDHVYFWNGERGGKSITFSASHDTTIYVAFGDVCMNEFLEDSIKITVRPDIVFSQSNDTTICEGNQTVLTIIPQGGTGLFTYETSTGTTGSGSNFSFETNKLTPGKHDFWIRVTDHCTYPEDTAFYTITVRDSLNIVASLDTTICKGTKASLYATGGGGVPTAYKYNWGNGPSSTSRWSIQPEKDASYTVRLTDGCSVYEPTDEVLVAILDSLNVTIQGPDTACYGEQINLTSTVNGGMTGKYEYSWIPDSVTSSSRIVVMRQSKDFVLTVDDGCTPKNGRAVHTVLVRPPLSIETSMDTVICIGEPVTISARVSGGVDNQRVVTWNQSLGTGLVKRLSPSSSTVYRASLGDQCSDSISKEIKVTVNPRPLVDFSVNGQKHCKGIPVQFNDNSVSDPPNQYLWVFGNGEASANEKPSLVYNDTGFYDIKLKVTNTFGCSDSLIKDNIVEVIEHPRAHFTFTPENPSFTKPTVFFFNSSLHYITSTWDFGDGNLSNQDNPSNGYNDTGRYTVRLRVENDIGCFSDTSTVVYVEDDVIVNIPSAFTPNSDGLNDAFSPYVRGMKSYEFMVYNRWGEVLFRSNDVERSWDGKVDGQRVVLGFYFYHFTGIDMNGKEVERNGIVNLIY